MDTSSPSNEVMNSNIQSPSNSSTIFISLNVFPAQRISNPQAALLHMAVQAYENFLEGPNDLPPHEPQDSLPLGPEALLDSEEWNNVRDRGGPGHQAFMSGESMPVSMFNPRLGGWGWWGYRFGRRKDIAREDKRSKRGRFARGTDGRMRKVGCQMLRS
jgi:hypothetical protein